MITDTEIKAEGYKAFSGALGLVKTEKFITLVMREPFDYTKWQKSLLADKSIDEISGAAMRFRKCEKAKKVAKGRRC